MAESNAEERNGHSHCENYVQEVKLEMDTLHKYSNKKRKSHRERQTDFVPHGTNPLIFMEFLDLTPKPLGIDEDERPTFILKVLLMLLLMFLLTAGIECLLFNVPQLKDVYSGQNGDIIFSVGGGVWFLSLFMVSCWQYARGPPCVYILTLFVVVGFTLMMSYFIIRQEYEYDTMMYSFVTVFFIILFTVLVSCTTIDFTKYLIYLVQFVAASIACCVGLFLIKVYSDKELTIYFILVYVLQVFLVSFVYIFELQMVLVGRFIMLESEEWVAGAVFIYASILITLILRLMMMVGCVTEDDD